MKTIKFNKYKSYNDSEFLRIINFKLNKFNEKNYTLYLNDINDLIIEAKRRKISLKDYELANKIFYN